jgi:TatD DNase family protein
MQWIDSHCHLHHRAFDLDFASIRQQAREQGVVQCLLPATHRADWSLARARAHQTGDAYALGIHPWWASSSGPSDLDALSQTLAAQACDPQWVAVGEIGLDFSSPERATLAAKAQQQAVYEAQLDLAISVKRPVILHVRQAGDLAYLFVRQRIRAGHALRGIVHAFSGSVEQAQQWLTLGFKLGVGGAATYPQAHRLHRLLKTLPIDSWVLETDAPDMPPIWLREASGENQAWRNSPLELPRIGMTLAQIQGIDPATWAEVTTATARAMWEK